MHGDVAQAGIAFERIEHLPAAHARQFQVEQDGIGVMKGGQFQPALAIARQHAFEIFFVGVVKQHFRKFGVIFDDQQDLVAFLDFVAVIVDRFGISRMRELEPSSRAERSAQQPVSPLMETGAVAGVVAAASPVGR